MCIFHDPQVVTEKMNLKLYIRELHGMKTLSRKWADYVKIGVIYIPLRFC